MKDCINIGLLGVGTVGSGVLHVLEHNGGEIAKKAGCKIEIKKILVRNPQKAAELGKKYAVAGDFEDIVNDPDIDIVVELIGREHPAKEYIASALEHGKNVVTANKDVLAKYGRELFPLAELHNVDFMFEGAVGGGIPWLTNLERVKRLDTVCAVGGIMNGTTNFIMDAMHKAPVDFPAILKEAQDLGYAEADPSADIDGDDIRRKLCISANIAFDAALEETAIPTFGIRTVTAADIAAFRAHGFACKLLARAESTENGVCAYVEPTLVGAGDLEAAVPANFNLITYVLRPGRGALPHGGERGAGLPDGAVRQAGLLHRQGCAHVPDQRRGAPLLRPHQRAGCVPAGPHRGDVGQRRGRHRRGGRVRNAGLGQGSA